ASATAIPTTLYGIDTGSSQLVVQGGLNGAPSPNGGAITAVGPLGVTVLANSDAGFDISVGPGLGRAFAALNVGGVTGLFNINLASGQASLIGNIGNGASAISALTSVPDSTVVVGSFPGAVATVFSINGDTGQTNFGLLPFGGYTGGVRVASGDVTGDGVPDI